MTAGSPAISVIIPALNAGHMIADCVRALQRQDIATSNSHPCPYEIIVVDNGSTDDTRSQAELAGAQVIEAPSGGAAAARNAGIGVARGELVCFTDADCIPTADWLRQITTPLADPEIIGCKGVYATRQPELVARFVQVEYEDKYDLLRPQRRIDFIDTYSAAYRREVLVANGGFEERIYYVEDQELSFRLAARGYQMVFQPSAVVYHRHSHTLATYFRKKFMIAYWKAQVVRRFPTQGVKDSHTPQVMKLQMMLVTLAAMLFAGAFFVPPLIWPVVALLLAFTATTIPFVRKAWPKDRAVALASPFLLAVRALALSGGYAWGILRPQPGISGEETTIGGVNYVGKRFLDIVGSTLGLLVALLLGPFLALAIKLDSPGPILFRQERVGQGGQPFTIYKFRSMHPGAEAALDRLIDLNRLAEPVFKLDNDPRITTVGRFMRRWSLDELPQCWNVLKGDMSLIGPRPEETRIVAHYSDWHRRRLAIKPGMTGPMQVNGRGDLPLDARVQLELDYIENYSLWRDLVILARTIPAVLSGRGAR